MDSEPVEVLASGSCNIDKSIEVRMCMVCTGTPRYLPERETFATLG